MPNVLLVLLLLHHLALVHLVSRCKQLLLTHSHGLEDRRSLPPRPTLLVWRVPVSSNVDAATVLDHVDVGVEGTVEDAVSVELEVVLVRQRGARRPHDPRERLRLGHHLHEALRLGLGSGEGRGLSGIKSRVTEPHTNEHHSNRLMPGKGGWHSIVRTCVASDLSATQPPSCGTTWKARDASEYESSASQRSQPSVPPFEVITEMNLPVLWCLKITASPPATGVAAAAGATAAACGAEIEGSTGEAAATAVGAATAGATGIWRTGVAGMATGPRSVPVLTCACGCGVLVVWCGVVRCGVKVWLYDVVCSGAECMYTCGLVWCGGVCCPASPAKGSDPAAA